jgi:hypothetical protein
MKQRFVIRISIPVLLLSLLMPIFAFTIFSSANASAANPLSAAQLKNWTYAFNGESNITATPTDGSAPITFTNNEILDGGSHTWYLPGDNESNGNNSKYQGLCANDNGNTEGGYGGATPGINIQRETGSTSDPAGGIIASNNGSVSATLDIGILTGDKCAPQHVNIMVDTSKLNSFEWDGTNLTTEPGSAYPFTFDLVNDSNGLVYSAQTNGNNNYCSQRSDGTGLAIIVLDSTPTTANATNLKGGWFCQTKTNASGDDNGTSFEQAQLSKVFPSKYHVQFQFRVNIGGTWNQSAANAPSSTSGTTASIPSLSCHAGFNPLNWLVCGVVDGLVGIIGDMNGVINNELSVGTNGNSDDPNSIFCDGGSSANNNTAQTCDAYEQAWSTFRNIALGLLAIVGLSIVASEALGFEFLDAYTVRKALPRLLVAAIGITLSWALLRFFVVLTNDIGFGIRALIYAPFSGFTDSINLGGSNDWAISLATAGAITIMGIFGLLSFVATAAVALFVGFIILVLRQIIIIVLIILAPIAILMYILPNTNNIYKIWWDSFSKALFMFPIIAALIASGRVFAAVTAGKTNNPGGGDPLSSLIAFAAYFAPYFLLPLTFRFAGGALRTIGGFTHSRSSGAYGALNKFRSNKAKTNFARTRAGQRWDENWMRFGNKDWMSVGHLANRAAVNAFDQDELLPYRAGKTRVGKYVFGRGSAKAQNAIDSGTVEQSQKALQHLESEGFARDGYRALAGDYNKFKGRDRNSGKLISQEIAEAGFVNADGSMRRPRSLADYEKISQIMMNSDSDKEREGGADLYKQRGFLADIKNSPDTAFTDTQAVGLMGLMATGYDGTNDDLAAIGNSLGSRIGMEGANNVMNVAQKIGKQSRPDMRDTYGVTMQGGGPNGGELHFASSYSATDANGAGKGMNMTAVNSVITSKATDFAYGAKGESVKEMADTITSVADGSAQQYHSSLAYQANQQYVAARDRGDEVSAARLMRERDTHTANAATIASQQENIQQLVVGGAMSPQADAGQKAEWQKIQQRLAESGVDMSAVQRRVLNQNDDQQFNNKGEDTTGPTGPP